MPVDNIRTRIAEYEAEMERRREAEAARHLHAEPPATAEDDPWQHLFNTPWLDAEEAARIAQAGDDFSWNSWLAEGLRGLRAWLPAPSLSSEFWQHLRGAERELLLAVRVLLDNRLALMEARNQPATDTDRLQEIEIEF
ncbi:MAG: hypothetical protein ABTQ73_01760 [Caldilineales bacterium]